MATDYAPTPVEDFLDPDDPAMFPRLTPEQVEYLAGIGAQQTFGRGDQVFGHGQRETPLYIVQSGAVDIIDHAPEGDRYFTQCQERTFIGDLSMFTGEPTLAAGYAAGPTSLIALPPEDVRRVVATAPADLGDLLLRIMVARRDWLMGRGLGQQKLIGSRWSGEAFAVRELLERNLVPFTWHDLATDEEGRALLDGFGIGEEECPVLIRSDDVIRRATVTSVADELGLRAQVDGQAFDVVVLGGGPAGLASAVYAASEGLSTLVLERFAPGGQAGTSARIENYLGFPTGLTGSDLARRATLQARKFGAVISSVHEASHVRESGPDGLREIELADGQRVQGRCVVLAPGADYRRLPAENAERFEGLGLYYAATHIEAQQCAAEDVVVVGRRELRRPSGGQSRRQCAPRPRRRPSSARGGDVALPGRSDRGQVERPGLDGVRGEGARGRREARVRGDLGRRSRSARRDHGRVRDDRRLTEVGGARRLRRPGRQGLRGHRRGGRRHPDFSRHWNGADRGPLMLECTRPGVFAIGDVRRGSTKRVASAVGDGALVVRSIHTALGGQA